MCGIVGSYPKKDLEVVSKALDILTHRGPDEYNLSEPPNATLGHSRLAILDVADGHQPMAEEDRWIIFNGEIYNYRSLRKHLPADFSTDSDTEVVLKLYTAYGPGCVNMLDGMFAFALVDKGKLYLARDPLGIKPLYYAIENNRIYFASEIKALAWMAADVREFPPGHWWHSAYGLHRYARIDSEQTAPLDDTRPGEHDLAKIQNHLREAVHKRLIADDGVPVGISLSGGLDSSIVTALAAEAKTSLDTFVVGTPDSEDVAISYQVADHLGTRHHAYVYTFDEMLSALPQIIYHLESFDAALVRSAIPNYFLSQLASDHVKVILTGEGADELFGGYEYLRSIDDPGELQNELRLITGGLHNTNLQRADRMSMAHGLEARVPFLDMDFVQMAFDLPAGWKLQEESWPEKEMLRRAFSGLLPQEIVDRPKQKFSDGAGSMDLMADYADRMITNTEYVRERRLKDSTTIRSKEELYYYHIFQSIFGDRLSPKIVGRTRSVTQNEL